MRVFSRKKAAAAVAAIVVLGGAVAAYAYWTQGGSGTGSASTGSTQNLTVNQTTLSTTLYPGGSVSLSGTFDNPNSSRVKVTTLTAAIDPAWTGSQTNTGKPACTAGDYSISGTATIGSSGFVPAGTGVGSWSGLTLSMSDTNANQDNCKGVSVPIVYTAS